MKLYYSPGSCALAVHIILIESGLNYETESVNLRQQPIQTASGVVFNTISPKGYVPALIINAGQLLTESQVLLQYVADQATSKQLIPVAGTLARYQTQEWLAFIATEIHKGFAPLWNPAATAEQKEAAWANLAKRLDWLNQELGDKAYLMGDFSVADPYLFTCLNWANYHQRTLESWTNVVAFMERVRARPATQQALKEEGLI